jgi:threonine dehydratase
MSFVFEPKYESVLNAKPDYSTHLKNILIASTSIYDVAIQTQLDKSKLLSDKFENTIFYKREDTQPIKAYKIRGSFYKMSKLLPNVRAKGIITCSAGNHAQGVALSAKILQCSALIIMPKTTPQIKITAVENLGATVFLFGESYQEALVYALNAALELDKTFVPAFDDLDVIAGNGTIAVEIANQLKGNIANLDYIFVPIGGGGLISGIAIYIKSLYPHIKIIGVGPLNGCAMYESIKENKKVVLNKVDMFIDGVAVKTVGDLTFDICKNLVDDIICVSNDELCTAIKNVYTDTRSILEPSGALSVAGATKYIDQHTLKYKNIICILSGANMNFDKLKFVCERANIGENSEANIVLKIPEKTNSLVNFLKCLEFESSLSLILNVTQFHYRYHDPNTATIFFGFSVMNEIGTEFVINHIRENNYIVHDLKNDNLTKAHLPFLTGGFGSKLKSEYLFTINFPEIPGSLFKVLLELEALNINITMFHYRHMGELQGNVLLGIQVEPENYTKFIEALDKITCITYKDETTNEFLNLF